MKASRNIRSQMFRFANAKGVKLGALIKNANTDSIPDFMRLLEMEEGTKSAVYLTRSLGNHVHGGFDM
jgi:hypothetical protein